MTDLCASSSSRSSHGINSASLTEVFKRELVTMSTSVHVENSGRLWGALGPIGVHSTAENCSDPLCRRRSSLFQEARSNSKLKLSRRVLMRWPTNSPHVESVWPVACQTELDRLV
jgi:hypothetical protein